MRLSMKFLLALVVVSAAGRLAILHADEATQFQKNSESAIEETEEVQGGKTVRRLRTGKVKNRIGDAKVGDIEDDEVDQVRRRQKSLSLTSFGFGPFGSSNIGRGQMLYGASYGRHWEVSTIGEIVAEVKGAANGHAGFGAADLGFNIIPMTGSISPVVGLAFGAGYGAGQDRNDVSIRHGGFSLQGNLGLRMFRLADTQMEIMGTYAAILSDPSPNIFGVQLRVLF